jgi:hypothetical protein
MRHGVYAAPRRVTDPGDCYFYHTMDLPGLGTIRGEWDLRGREAEYLGGIDCSGKRVLELGTASGALGFWMERQQAEVVGYDLSPAQDWDLVPFAGSQSDHPREVAARKTHIGRINNAWWFARAALGSSARVAYGDVYHVPAEIGPVDIVTFGSILLHLRDPFLALQNGLRLARETAVVVDLAPPGVDPEAPIMRFLPDPATGRPNECWWSLSPGVVRQMLGVLGFEVTGVTFHAQKFEHHAEPMVCYTTVARRVRGAVNVRCGWTRRAGHLGHRAWHRLARFARPVHTPA